MITKEQKQLIEQIKDASGTSEFLSVSDLITRINAAIEGYLLDCETMFNLIANWNHFLRNTPLSMDLFIGEGAIFEGFVLHPISKDCPVIYDRENDIVLVRVEIIELPNNWELTINYTNGASFSFEYVSTLELLSYKIKGIKKLFLK